MIIDINGLAKTFKGGFQALDRVTLTFGTGAMVALIGASGSRKSTLLHAAFLLQKEGFSLPKAVATVSRNLAMMVGQRADFLRVRMVNDIPVVLGVWKAGAQIA